MKSMEIAQMALCWQGWSRREINLTERDLYIPRSASPILSETTLASPDLRSSWHAASPRFHCQIPFRLRSPGPLRITRLPLSEAAFCRFSRSLPPSFSQYRFWLSFPAEITSYAHLSWRHFRFGSHKLSDIKFLLMVPSIEKPILAGTLNTLAFSVACLVITLTGVSSIAGEYSMISKIIHYITTVKILGML